MSTLSHQTIHLRPRIVDYETLPFSALGTVRVNCTECFFNEIFRSFSEIKIPRSTCSLKLYSGGLNGRNFHIPSCPSSGPSCKISHSTFFHRIPSSFNVDSPGWGAASSMLRELPSAKSRSISPRWNAGGLETADRADRKGNSISYSISLLADHRR